MKYIDYVFNCLMDCCMLMAQILLVAIIGILCMSVFCQYVLDKGVHWSYEVGMMLMVYLGFISMAYGVKEYIHLGTEIFYSKFPNKVQKVFDKCFFALISILGITLTSYGILLAKSTMNNVMRTTHWPVSTLYIIVPISGVLIAYFSFVELIGYKSVYKTKRRNR